MSYRHLTEGERYDIYERRREGATVTEIAAALERSKATISREVARNSGERGYRPRQAQDRAVQRKQKRRGGKIICPRSWARCEQLLKTGHSPEQAVNRANLEGQAPISHETAYKRVYADKHSGGKLWRNLRCCKKRRKRYGSGRQRRGRIVGRVGIEKRCPRVEKRLTVGHWEGDTVIGQNHKYALVTLVERKTGFALVRKVKARKADGVADTIIDALKPFRNLVRTVTFDNGLEFAAHSRIAGKTGCKVYFADPYSSWQRGTNENWNGLLRQYFPKKSCFSTITAEELEACQNTLNSRARKRLAWRTPCEAIGPSAKRAGVALAL